MMEQKVVGQSPRRQLARAARLILAGLALGACSTPESATPRTAPSTPPAPETAGPSADPRAPAGTRGAEDTAPAATEGVRSRVRLGIDVLLSDSLHLVRDRRVGLITNHTGLSWNDDEALSTIDRLHEHPEVRLVALFSPEHGIRGSADAGVTVVDETDPETGLPIYSLYGDTRRPTPAMLRDLDVLLFDIQDIGARYYTYVWTMTLAMAAAGENEVSFLVLDRPNPIGGRLVQGNVLDPAYATFVGLYPVPMRHGLTAGEMARVIAAEHGIEADLRVIPMRGWERTLWYDETGLPWVAPSPNMPSLESATHYPGTCLFEGTNLSVGRGTREAFRQIGAPWLDARALADRLNARVDGGELRGVRFDAVTFTPEAPGDRKYGGELVRGIRLTATERDVYDPTRAAVAALIEIRALHPERLEWRVSHFDRLAGSDRLRQAIAAGASLQEATASWAAEAAAFEALRRPFLLYD